ncbi:MAG: hypothetical protein E4H38_00390, partial [Gemmatimonadales bacterium]
MTRISRGTLLLLLLTSAPLAAQRLYRLEVSPVATVTSYDGVLELKPSVGGGLRLGYWVVGPLSIEAEGTYARAVTKSSTTHLTAVTLGGSALA